MKESLYIIGFGTVVAVCMGCAYLIICGIIRGMKILKYRYKEKHRYDKPPTAKCYCKDCTFHGDDGKCYGFVNERTNDSWFCAWAERKENEK